MITLIGERDITVFDIGVELCAFLFLKSNPH
jgi:hypothetical protein